MKNFNFDELDVVELKSGEVLETEGGNPIIIGVVIYLISEDWPNIKKGAMDAFNDAMN